MDRQWARFWWVIAALAAILPMGMIGMYAFYCADVSVRRLVQTNNSGAAAVAAELLGASFNHSVELARTVVNMPGMVSGVQRHDVEAVRERLRRTVERNPAVDRAIVLDKQGIIWSDWPVAPESLNRSFAHRDYFRGLSASWQPYISEVFQRQAEPRPLVVAIAVPITDERDQVLGGLILQHRVDAITAWTRRAVVGAGGEIVLLDPGGVVAGHPRLTFEGVARKDYAELAPVRRALDGRPTTAEYREPLTGNVAVATFLPLSVPGGRRWVVIAQQDRATAYAPVKTLGWQIGLATLIVTVMALAAAISLARTGEMNRRMKVKLSERNELLQQAIAAEQQAHAALKKAQIQLVQSEKLAGLGQMVAGVAHEINNPLSFVSNNVAVVQRDVLALRELLGLYQQADPALGQHLPELARHIEEMAQRIDLPLTLDGLADLLNSSREGLRRIQQIVKDLREFARVDDVALHAADLNEGIRSTANIIHGRARKKKVDLELDLGQIPPVTCCLTKINQVVLNLLSNAIDASREGGKVTVRTRSQSDQVLIEVADQGSGIDPAIRERIFDPFFTTKKQGEGTGLGLSISYGIVQDHHGTIEVESDPGHGARFTVRLPTAPPPSGDLPRRDARAAASISGHQAVSS